MTNRGKTWEVYWIESLPSVSSTWLSAASSFRHSGRKQTDISSTPHPPRKISAGFSQWETESRRCCTLCFPFSCNWVKNCCAKGIHPSQSFSPWGTHRGRSKHSRCLLDGPFKCLSPPQILSAWYILGLYFPTRSKTILGGTQPPQACTPGDDRQGHGVRAAKGLPPRGLGPEPQPTSPALLAQPNPHLLCLPTAADAGLRELGCLRKCGAGL